MAQVKDWVTVTSHLSLLGTEGSWDQELSKKKTFCKSPRQMQKVAHPIRVQFLRKMYKSVNFSHFVLNLMMSNLCSPSYILKLILLRNLAPAPANLVEKLTQDFQGK